MQHFYGTLQGAPVQVETFGRELVVNGGGTL